ncbi:thrombospondin type 3 repeat-containing protein [Pseudomonadales bacterium]|nr:thrombospondin type 3 repeat-containing protein [Pseudomonadales bacterium]
MKLIKLMLISAILISSKSLAEMKLYEIIVDNFSRQYTVKFLLDDEIAPDYTNNANLNMWSTASDVISIRDDGSVFNDGSLWKVKEFKTYACYMDYIGFDFSLDDNFSASIKIEGCNSVIGFGPDNTFSFTESMTVFAAMDVDGCSEWGCTTSTGNQVSISSISITPFIGTDNDSDFIPSNIDNCPNHFNPDQLNSDGDGLGNACDSLPYGDSDGDGIDNASDNCVNVANSNQANLDGDSKGDACDLDVDGDSVIDTLEVAAGTDPNDPSDGNQAELSALEALGINKQVPAMGSIGLLTLGLSMLGLGAARFRKK